MTRDEEPRVLAGSYRWCGLSGTTDVEHIAETAACLAAFATERTVLTLCGQVLRPTWISKVATNVRCPVCLAAWMDLP